jgi:23S rRNA pseudouridine1911/1915/1917 synthase
VDQGQTLYRVDKYLINRIMNVSRNRIQNAAKSGCILVNEKPVKSNYKVKPEDIISIVLPEPPRDKDIKAENIALNIVYEDEDLLIVNKEAGMVVHPAYGNFNGTLVNALLYHYQNLPEPDGEEFRAGLVHRIDKDTSGLLVIAKNEAALAFLARQFYDHSIERKYRVLVWGSFDEESGLIDAALGRDPKDRKIMRAWKDPEAGKKAVTHYRVLEQFNYCSLLECVLETGRTHQIRAHMKFIGHPVFGDPVYGGREIPYGPSFTRYKQFINNCLKIVPRQALHAKSLGFMHPVSKKMMHFDSEVPEDMHVLIEKWRKYSASL